ncbi:uncharacterized protein LOC101859984 [Aplysia californica]|uniref:Uncharacterized protein LOC101859984 n=1 Tax=Aplysia californica TaxID=6500 RepID=A0ABM0K829_APLCA|nr:uncharacterized protein LOC101859984 [Aplysia californica]
MTVQGEKMAAALRLWDSLVDTAREQQAAGQSTRVTLTAIKDTARAMQAIVTDTVSYVTDILRLAGTNQGTSNNKRALSKRGWSVGVDVGYGSHSGGRVGVSVGFSF